MPIHSLLRMKIFSGRSYCTAVDISWMHIWIAGFAGDVYDLWRPDGPACIADGGRQAIAHGAQAAGRHPAVRLVEMEELSGPHLVLADLCGDVDLSPLRLGVAGQGVEPLDCVLRLDHRVEDGRIARSPCGRAIPSICSHHGRQGARLDASAAGRCAFHDLQHQVFQNARPHRPRCRCRCERSC